MKLIRSHAGFSVGQSIRTKIETSGEGEEGSEVTFPAGTEGKILAIHDYGKPQGWSFTVSIGDEIANAFDEEDGLITNLIEPLGETLPDGLKTFEIGLRAIKNLTAIVTVQAMDEEDARRKAIATPFKWEASDPEDVRIEFANPPS